MKSDPTLKRFLASITREKIKKIYLFGSRARGTHRPDSDYDLLLVVEEGFSIADREQLYDSVMDVLLETGRLISLKIFKESLFKKLTAIPTPFMGHVLNEGVLLG